jgi:hypothetical protein
VDAGGDGCDGCGTEFQPEPFDLVRQDDEQAVMVQCPVCVGDVRIARPTHDPSDEQLDATDVWLIGIEHTIRGKLDREYQRGFADGRAAQDDDAPR